MALVLRRTFNLSKAEVRGETHMGSQSNISFIPSCQNTTREGSRSHFATHQRLLQRLPQTKKYVSTHLSRYKLKFEKKRERWNKHTLVLAILCHCYLKLLDKQGEAFTFWEGSTHLFLPAATTQLAASSSALQVFSCIPRT